MISGINTTNNIPLQLAEGAICGGLFFMWLIPLIINIIIGVWMYKDAKKRGENGALWFLIGFFLSLLGLIIWLVVRSDKSEPTKTCLSCGQQIDIKYSTCPYCGKNTSSQTQQQYQQPQQQQYGQQPPQQSQQHQQYQQPPQQPPQQQSNQCPNCGGQMRYINEHNRWYCDNCQEYK